MTTPAKLRSLVVLIAALMVAACAGSSPSISASSPEPASPAAASTMAAQTATPADQVASKSARLVALAKNTTATLWALDGSQWHSITDLAGATGIAAAGDGLAVMRAGDLHFLPTSDLTTETRLSKLSWPGGTAPDVAAFAIADDGKVALVIAGTSGTRYAVAGSDGMVSAPEPAATQPFAPLVAWLDANRQLILVTDPQQVSRLGVRTGSTAETLTGIAGCRWFAVSGDGKTIAVVTDTGLYADTAMVVLGKSQSPARIDQIASTDVAWSLALSRDGQHLAVLEGRVGDDGTPTNVREVVYSHSGSAWKKDLEVAVPFAGVLGQAWVG